MAELWTENKGRATTVRGNLSPEQMTRISVHFTFRGEGRICVIGCKALARVWSGEISHAEAHG